MVPHNYTTLWGKRIGYMGYIPAEINVSNFIESYRNIGYSIETAISDIIDNSIAAKASEIQINMILHDEKTCSPRIMILDNGFGMDNEELIQAMHLACHSPLEKRNPEDLGRFGLGLKSASFSQCKLLTVISRKKGCITCAKAWDIDHVRNYGKLEIEDCPVSEYEDLLPYETGTVVIWDRIDRVNLSPKDSEQKNKEHWNLIRNKIYNHIAITYGAFKENISFFFNGNQIRLWDPFCLDKEETILLADEYIAIGNDRIRVRPYILPLGIDETEGSQRELGKTLNDMQGFYIYRNNRLILYGTWLGLPKLSNKEAYRLARIKIDIGNSMDELWQIDIKKENAVCPPSITDRLLSYANKARQESSNKFRKRGKTLQRKSNSQYEPSYLWTYGINKDKKPYFEINRKNPVIKGFIDTLDSKQHENFLFLLKCFENYLPIMSILEQETLSDEKYFTNEASDISDKEIKLLFTETINQEIKNGVNRNKALQKCLQTEPFSQYPHLFIDEYKEAFPS